MIPFYAQFSISHFDWISVENDSLRIGLMDKIDQVLKGSLNLQQKVFLYYQFSLISKVEIGAFSKSYAWALFGDERSRPIFFQKYIAEQLAKLKVIEREAKPALEFIAKKLETKNLDIIKSPFEDLMLKDKNYVLHKIKVRPFATTYSLIPKGIFRVLSDDELIAFFLKFTNISHPSIVDFIIAIFESYNKEEDQRIIKVILNLKLPNVKFLPLLNHFLKTKPDVIEDLITLWPDANETLNAILSPWNFQHNKTDLEKLKEIIKKNSPSLIAKGANLPEKIPEELKICLPIEKKTKAEIVFKEIVEEEEGDFIKISLPES